MSRVVHPEAKILSAEDAKRQINAWRVTGKTIAFTNGVFDLLHQGHIASLVQAAAEGARLVVGVNSDASVKRLKGDDRPIQDEKTRALILAALSMVDVVVLFEEDTPIELITSLLPDTLIKGGDYKPENIVGAKEVMAAGGKVIINPLVENTSTTLTINRMR